MAAETEYLPLEGKVETAESKVGDSGSWNKLASALKPQNGPAGTLPGQRQMAKKPFRIARTLWPYGY
jgi:hypothetical protein